MATLIFDYDGTLHNTMCVYGPAFPAGYNFLKERGYVPERTWTPEEIQHFVGYSARETWTTIAPDLTDADRETVTELVRGLTKEALLRGEARLYDGVPEMLDALKAEGHTLVLLSNCNKHYLGNHNQVFHLDRRFTDLLCAENFGWATKPEIFRQIRDNYEGPFIAVGDRNKDIALAAENRLPSIACLYGYGTEEELAPATEKAKHPSEIPALVEKILTDSVAL